MEQSTTFAVSKKQKLELPSSNDWSIIVNGCMPVIMVLNIVVLMFGWSSGMKPVVRKRGLLKAPLSVNTKGVSDH